MSNILDGLEIPSSQENINDLNDDPDRRALRKRYLLQLDELSFKFRICTHPFRLFQSMIILSSITFITYIFRNYNCVCDAYKLLHNLLGYIATFVFSSIFTWFLENYGKNKDDDDD